MDYPQNARMTVYRREQLGGKVLAGGCTLKQAEASFNVSAKTGANWRAIFAPPGWHASATYPDTPE